MAHKFGLKLWSTNTDYYFDEAKRLYANGVFSYVEMYVIPDSGGFIEKWKTLGVPINLHCPHFLHGFNLASKEKENYNRQIYDQVKQFADELCSDYIVFHCGIDGTVEETVRQLKNFNESRAVIENKPYRPRPEVGGRQCRGATVEEIKYILKEVGCGFCLDVGHAICSANSQKIDRWKYLEEFNKLSPKAYHLTDMEDIESECDSHIHIGKGQMDVRRVLSFIDEGSVVTVETEKSYERDLRDFEHDIALLRVFLDCRNVILSKMTEEYIYNSYKWIKNAELRELFLMQHEPSLENHLQHFENLKYDDTQYVFAICVGGVHVGNCGFKYVNSSTLSAEIWIYIGESNFRNLGLGRNAVLILLNLGKELLNLQKVIVHVADFNEVAIKLYKSVGFVPMGEENDDMWKRTNCSVIKMELDL
ncbi:MAG: GNAT family N-acetyltransferase [Holosporaceae bacterium]|jgi:RimJ/RimL family protein N-acetyltransferase/endonuclease IV|nr:GNAT family N-acetyltransferase [Holosporaceae bacterium]